MKALSCTFLFVLFVIFGQAQDLQPSPEKESAPTFYFQMNFITGLPLADFKKEMTDDFGLGGDFTFLYRFKETSFSMGFQLGAMLHQQEKLKFEETVIADYTREYKLVTRNNSYFGHGVFRFQPEVDFPIKPYFDAYFGTQRLFTNTVLSEGNRDGDDDGDRDVLDRVREYSDWLISYGGGIGLQIDLGGGDILLNLQCAYLKSGHAAYMVRNPNAVVLDDTAEVFELQNSAIDLLMPKIGFVFRLQDCD